MQCNAGRQATANFALSRADLDALAATAGVDSTGYSVKTDCCTEDTAGPSIWGSRTEWIGLDSVSTCDRDGGDWRRVCWCERTVSNDVQHKIDEKKFGASSLYFDGDGDFISVRDSDDWDFGPGLRTLVVCWAREPDQLLLQGLKGSLAR